MPQKRAEWLCGDADNRKLMLNPAAYSIIAASPDYTAWNRFTMVTARPVRAF